MVQRILFLVILTFLQSCASMSAKDDRSNESVAGPILNNVVRITTSWKDGAEQNGFGFIVGERAGYLYIATANHLLRDEKRSVLDQAASSVSVEFRDSPALSHEAEILGSSNPRIDLGVIRAKAPTDVEWNTSGRRQRAGC